MKPDWLPFDEALNVILRGLTPLDPEDVPLKAASGRVLAEPIVSPIELPRWTNSAMDGFAVRSADIAGARRQSPVTLDVIEDVPAGAFPTLAIGPGQATRVMTGAPVPDGADSVVRVEMTDGASPAGGDRSKIHVFSADDAGRNIRHRGEELSTGDVAVPAGEETSAGVIGMAASLGYASLRVIRRPRVAILASGDELVTLERFEEVVEGRRIVSSNSYTLAAQLRAAKCEIVDLGIARDHPADLREAILRAAGCDALITSAGISVGEHDYVKDVLQELDAEVAFWRVRIRPGSPFAFGTIGALGGMPWFGLPGNPVSSAVTFELLARPALLRMAGHEKVVRRRIRARLKLPVVPVADITQFVRVRLSQAGTGEWVAEPTGAQGSNLLTSFARASGLMIVPPGDAPIASGALMEVIPLESAWTDDPAVS